MDEASARATLGDLAEGAPRAVATIPRREVEEALEAEGPPDLILDVTSYAGDLPAKSGTLSVSWSREDLEELLRNSEGESVTLAFDAEALRRALEADVEAHGLREAAAVIAVAIAAGTAAGTAAAQPAEGTGTSGYTAIEQVRADTGGTPPGAAIEAARSADQAAQASTVSGEYGMPRAMPADFPATTGADIEAARTAAAAEQAAEASTVSGEYGMPRAMPADFPAGGPNADIEAARAAAAAQQAAEATPVSGEYGMPRAMPADFPVTGPGADIEAARVAAAAEQAAEASTVSNIEAVRSAEIAATASVAEGTSIEAARSAAAEAARTADDGGITVSLPSPEATAAVVGGVALLITGAAFALRTRKPLRPA